MTLTSRHFAMRFSSLLIVATVSLLLANCAAPVVTPTATATIAPTPTSSVDPCLTTAKTYRPGSLPSRRIAFECSVNVGQGHSNLYVFDTVAGHITTLTNNANWNRDVQWSPDGTSIVFSTDRDGESSIYKVNPDGRHLTRLADGLVPRWSPDGKRIAFIKEDGIYLMNQDGSKATELVNDSTAIEASLVGLNLSWSPNGERIVFSSWRNGDSKIYVVNTDSGQQVNLTRNAEYEALPKWSPDGKSIAFLGMHDNMLGLYKTNADGSNLVGLTKATFVGGWYDWSPDSQSIAFLLANYKPYVMNADGSRTRPITEMAGHDSAWSPDGQLLACSSSSGQLYVVNISDGKAIQLTEGPGRKLYPAWSPK
jgi:Tol biopolymer transport system component